MKNLIITAIASFMAGATAFVVATADSCNKLEHTNYMKPHKARLYLSLTCSNGYVLNIPMTAEHESYIAFMSNRIDIVRMEFKAKE